MSTTVSKSILKTAGRTTVRFPFVLICAIVATLLLVIIIDKHNDDALQRILAKTIMTLYLGMLTAISCTIYCERRKIKRIRQYILNAIILLILSVYYFSLPNDLGYVAISRFMLLILACHALVSFAPYITLKSNNGFWQYNKLLFIRILTALFYAHALFAGLSLALLAIDNLFVLHINPVSFPRLYFCVMGIFNTIFFLSGIPEEVESLDHVSDYPKGLRIFTQFILLPLVTLYLMILYTYGLKIVFTQEWPVGWVSYLVIGFSVAGILALLLVWPLRNDAKHKWIATYIRYFYLALFPLIALLFIAIGKRVRQYGVTEDRYFIIIIAIWLLLMALYFLISRVKNIKFIPMTLLLFCLFAAYGPFSAYQTSEKSQFNRLKSLLQESNHLKNGIAVTSDYKVSKEKVKEISSATDYLITTHGLKSVQPLFNSNLDSLCLSQDSTRLYKLNPAKVLARIGIDYASPNEEVFAYGSRVNLQVKNDHVIDTKDFEFLVSFTIPGEKADKSFPQVFHLKTDSLIIRWIDNTTSLEFRYNNQDPVSLNLYETVNTLKTQYGLQRDEIPVAQMQYDLEDNGMHYRIIFSVINARLEERAGGLELFTCSGQLQVKRK